jgi:hypothetical protein
MVAPAPDVERLKTHLRGALIQPGDSGCEEARRVYNAMIERRPGSWPVAPTWRMLWLR